MMALLKYDIMYKTRAITDTLFKLTSYFPVVVITGARQVGKSTFVKHIFGQKADYVLLDSLIDVENARTEPELFLNSHRKKPLILDEIQYAPQLVPAIKRRIDQDRSPGQYILTGSQQWSVMKSISESLVGRAVFIDLSGFSLQEIAGKISKPWLAGWLENTNTFIETDKQRLMPESSLYEILWRGFLPEATLMPLDLVQKFHDAYLKTYIERDARQFADVSDWNLFGRFIRLVFALTAQEINYSQLGRELGITPQTSRKWVDILKATFQWFEIQAYSNNAVKRISNKPKGFALDTGLVCSAQAISSPNAVASHPLWGAIFETAAVSEIVKQCSVLNPTPNIYHWKTHRGAEVDIILERDGVFYPIEIKASARPSRKDISGIQAFRKTYPNIKVEKGLVIAPTEKFIQISENDYAIPWDCSIK
jgi:predicted AAA+ superfamily ATPase